MERIATLLEKIKELNHPNPTLIEVDLMMDYSRVLYADLFEWRKKVAFNDALNLPTAAAPAVPQPSTTSQMATLPSVPMTTMQQPEPMQKPEQHDEPEPVVATDDQLTPLPENKELETVPPPVVEPLTFLPSAEDAQPVAYPAKHYSNADIRQLIGVNDKYQFISELFGNNTDAYEDVISELNTFDTEEEAIVWIKNSVGNQFGWHNEMESVQSFYRLLGEFFSTR